MEFETRAIHVGQEPDPATGAIVPPISLSTTFAQDAVGKHRALPRTSKFGIPAKPRNPAGLKRLVQTHRRAQSQLSGRELFATRKRHQGQ